MKNKSLVLLLWIGCLSVAYAKDSVPLCAPPQVPNCVQPNWGQVGPDGTDEIAAMPSGGDGPRLTRAMPAPTRLSVEMQPVAASSGSPHGQPTLKAVIDANAMFVRETAALTSAILRARFDRNGRVVEGGARIAAAAIEAAEKAGDRYKLTLYIKPPLKHDDASRRMLGGRIQTLNAILGDPARYRDGGGKPAS